MRRIFCCLLAALLLCSCSPAGSGGGYEAGIMLDCARRYFSVSEIERYIDLLSGGSEPFLHLHLSDNENVGVECALLGQTAESAELLADGSCLNTETGKRFLSADQIRAILVYAEDNGVSIIPEVDMPAHMGGFFALAKGCPGDFDLGSIEADQRLFPGEMDISSPEAVRFSRALYSEYASLFSGCGRFHIGCDEYGARSGDGVAAYINDTAAFLRERGFSVLVWNDLLTKDDLPLIDAGLCVTYWSPDGDTDDPALSAARKKTRAGPADLCAGGFSLLNYDSYYLYCVPSAENCTEENISFAADDIRANWSPRRPGGEDAPTLPGRYRPLGAAVCVWGEDSGGMDADAIYRFAEPLYSAMLGVLSGERE